jgi:hypothetical protein
MRHFLHSRAASACGSFELQTVFDARRSAGQSRAAMKEPTSENLPAVTIGQIDKDGITINRNST